MIERINAQPAPVIARDVPSGLDATAGGLVGVPPTLYARLGLPVGLIFSRSHLIRLDPQGRTVPDGR